MATFAVAVYLTGPQSLFRTPTVQAVERVIFFMDADVIVNTVIQKSNTFKYHRAGHATQIPMPL